MVCFAGDGQAVAIWVPNVDPSVRIVVCKAHLDQAIQRDDGRTAMLRGSKLARLAKRKAKA